VSNFRPITDTFLASPQIGLDDLAVAKEMGVTLVVNNRPDGEEPSAPQGESIAAACEQAGISYVSIPVGHSGFSEAQIDQLIEALRTAEGITLAYCRSGTRSTLLWSLAQAKQGVSPEVIAASAAAGGYDVTPIRPMLDMLSSR